MDFRVLASGSSGNCYVAEAAGSVLLIEAGIRYADIQRALEHRVSALAGCLISHEHADHAGAAADVMRAGMDVYASRGCIDVLELIGHRCHAVRALEQFMIGPWTVLPFDAVHDAADPLGFLVAAPDGDRLLYLTDSAYCRYRFRGLTHLAIEANFSREMLRMNENYDPALKQRVLRNHMSIERAVELLRANDLSRVREIHLLHLSDRNSDAEAFRRAAAEASGKPVYVAGAREGIR